MLLTGQRGQVLDLAATVCGEGVGRAENGHVEVFSNLILFDFEDEISTREEDITIVVSFQVE